MYNVFVSIDCILCYRFKATTSIKEENECSKTHESNPNEPTLEERPSTDQNSPTTYVSVQVGHPDPPTTLGKFLQFFHCLAKRTLDDGKKISTYYSTPTREPDMELEKTDKKEPDGTDR